MPTHLPDTRLHAEPAARDEGGLDPRGGHERHALEGGHLGVGAAADLVGHGGADTNRNGR